MSKRFLLDANAFIEPRDRYYAYDICPGYWSTLVAQHEDRRVFSLDKIRGELVPNDKERWDSIAHWIKESVPDTFFKGTADQIVIDKYAEMVNWAFTESQYSDVAKHEFANVADGWLVAYAATNGLTVVTHERYAPEAKKRIPIPNVCQKFQVEYVDTFQMLRDLGGRFVQSTQSATR